jgi:hypothetical protein
MYIKKLFLFLLKDLLPSSFIRNKDLRPVTRKFNKSDRKSLFKGKKGES